MTLKKMSFFFLDLLSRAKGYSTGFKSGHALNKSKFNFKFSKAIQ